jgi:four helix bundle protein
MNYYRGISLGSPFELQVQVIASQNKDINEEEAKTLENKIIQFQKMISGFINRLDESLAS